MLYKEEPCDVIDASSSSNVHTQRRAQRKVLRICFVVLMDALLFIKGNRVRLATVILHKSKNVRVRVYRIRFIRPRSTGRSLSITVGIPDGIYRRTAYGGGGDTCISPRTRQVVSPVSRAVFPYVNPRRSPSVSRDCSARAHVNTRVTDRPQPLSRQTVFRTQKSDSRRLAYIVLLQLYPNAVVPCSVVFLRFEKVFLDN